MTSITLDKSLFSNLGNCGLRLIVSVCVIYFDAGHFRVIVVFADVYFSAIFIELITNFVY